MGRSQIVRLPSQQEFLSARLRGIRKLTSNDDHSVFLFVAGMQNHVQALNFFGAFRLMRFDTRSIEEIDMVLTTLGQIANRDPQSTRPIGRSLAPSQVA